MQQYQMGAIESKFADIIWQGEPISSAELAKRAEKLLGWKKSTSYTVLKRLCNKGIFENRDGVVCSKISREEFYSVQSDKFVEETFCGSLPAFLAAFTARKPLNREEVELLRQLIDNYKEE